MTLSEGPLKRSGRATFWSVIPFYNIFDISVLNPCTKFEEYPISFRYPPTVKSENQTGNGHFA